MRVTITDIAKLAGVSHGTVSRVLNGAPIRITDARRREIESIAKRLNYTPNRSARTLKSGRHHLLGVVTYDITDAFAVECVSTMEVHLEQTAYRAQWISCAHAERRETGAVQVLYDIAQSVDGIIVIEANHVLSDADLITFWATMRTPIVTVIRKTDGGVISSVTIDDRRGTAELVRHLAELGHRDVAFCYSDDLRPTAEARHVAFQELTGEYGLSDAPDLQIPVGGSAHDGYEVGQALLKRAQLPTAVIAFKDLVAMGLVRACYEHKVNVPGDISIASFDNIRMSETSAPALTTMAANYTEIARSAIDELIRQIDEPDPSTREPRHHVSRPSLIVRESTAPPKAKRFD